MNVVDGVFVEAEKLIGEFRRVAPDAEIGFCLTPPGNLRDAAFVANYHGGYSRRGWHRIQHRLVECRIETCGEREAQRIFLIPTELNPDVIDGFPTDNAAHPNAPGYQQIGKTIYAWLKFRMHSASKPKQISHGGAPAVSGND